MKLAELRAVAAARTKGEWELVKCEAPPGHTKTGFVQPAFTPFDNGYALLEDATFIAAMAANIDRLLDVVEVAQKITSEGFWISPEMMVPQLDGGSRGILMAALAALESGEK